MPGASPGWGGFITLVASRLILRQGDAPAWARGLAWASVAGLAGLGLVLGLGVRGPVVVAGFWLAGFALLASALIVHLRAMLVVAVLGLALGVASLFVVLGVGSGIEGLLVSSLARLNGHAMVSKYGLDFFEYEAVAQQLERDERVRAASPFVFGVGAIVVVDASESEPEPASASEVEPESALDGEQAPVIVSIKGVDPERLAGFSSTRELFAVGDFGSLRPAGPRTLPGIVLGTRLARRLGARPGSRVRVVVPAAIRQDEGESLGEPSFGEFEVLGLLDTGFAEFDASFVLVHITAAQAIVFGQMRASGIEMELEHARLGTALPIAKELVAQLNRPRTDQRLLPWYRASSWGAQSATLSSIRQTKALLVLVLSLIVLVASGSLLGALLLMVRRERRHIGVLAALGAKPRQLFWVFELVGVGIGMAGSGLGLGLGALSLFALSMLRLQLDADIYMIDHLPVAFVFTDLLIPSGIAVFVCALVTGPIARQVSRMRPIELVQ
ncbi:Lipoprotein releasing system transmembrane protein LolC [Enhygromyxa salina]|uniref:Lipoprotein releasing system transmembrane protein LolC n=1 Tax=Enhygromyxa salina TaxID=215803 RepID=A0A0C1Z3W7_9BACT|nr:ABC transporter permease [Enhygromyxa salina]KIG12384.1 Lipoprotein releasing system transmembrane protein LolC [Enhygromyxa salina]